MGVQVQIFGEKTSRERMGCEGGLACHPERSEGSRRAASQIPRCAQDDTKRRLTSLLSKCLVQSVFQFPYWYC
jgi:hypothetical protein